MRDIAVTLAVFGSLPFILRRPWFGVLVWSWLGFMNPHRMAWGFSTTMPFAYIVAVTTLVALVLSREPKRISWTGETVILLLFIIWTIITTFFAVYPQFAWLQLEKILKIQVMIFIAMMLINTRERLHMLVWTIALSLGFYGVKGGIFTIMTGGAYQVRGPPDTFIGGNNEIGLALAMTVPLMYYLYRQQRTRLVRFGLVAAMVLTAIAAIGTQSRGALLGMAAMGVMLCLRGKQKLMILLVGGISAYAIAHIMPEAWYARMSTIREYEGDQSVTGRFAAWGMAFNLAKDRFFGGGFEAFRPEMFAIYLPGYGAGHDAHSIYFQVLGEHGFVGLGLFLGLALITWSSAWKIGRTGDKHQETMWLADLAHMSQVSMVAYATAGAFLGMAYFDYYYNLVLIVVMSRVILAKELVALSTPGTSEPLSETLAAPAGTPMALRGNRTIS